MKKDEGSHDGGPGGRQISRPKWSVPRSARARSGLVPFPPWIVNSSTNLYESASGPDTEPRRISGFGMIRRMGCLRGDDFESRLCPVW
jgi:hypothetical protein